MSPRRRRGHTRNSQANWDAILPAGQDDIQSVAGFATTQSNSHKTTPPFGHPSSGGELDATAPNDIQGEQAKQI
jgi:hypothetical protein